VFRKTLSVFFDFRVLLLFITDVNYLQGCEVSRFKIAVHAIADCILRRLFFWATPQVKAQNLLPLHGFHGIGKKWYTIGLKQRLLLPQLPFLI
jgi:hypothetical protein